MKFTELYSETLKFWPESIDIQEPKRSRPNLVPNELNNVWEKVEIATEKMSEWHQLMVFAIFNGYRLVAQKAKENDEMIIYSKNIDMVDVEKRFSENLNTEIKPRYPLNMREEYINDIKS